MANCQLTNDDDENDSETDKMRTLPAADWLTAEAAEETKVGQAITNLLLSLRSLCPLRLSVPRAFVVQGAARRYNPEIMMPHPLRRSLFLAAAVGCGFASCTELPNDIGVHPHRAARAWFASHFPTSDYWNDDPAARGKPKIVINLTTQRAFFYRGKTLIGKSTISSGRKEFETPPGKYRVTEKDADHISSEYGQIIGRSGEVLVSDANARTTPVPKGARFVGASMPYFMRFTDGYGMHAGFVPRYRASHGCIRLPEEMAKHFFDAAEVGTRVEVIEPSVMVQQ
jgi:hypothetical protein